MRPRGDTLLVWTGAPCTAGCPACPIDPAAAPPGVEPAALLAHLRGLAARPGRLAVLVGGEPLLRRDAPRLLAAIRAAGWEAGLIGTGRPLLYPQMRDRLRRLDLAYLRVQLFGVGDAHDRATATPGAYAQALEGVRGWLAESGAGCDVDVALSTRGRPLDVVAAELTALAGALPNAARIVVAVDPPSRAALPHAAALHAALAALAVPDAARASAVLEDPGAIAAAPLAPAFAAAPPLACCLGFVDPHAVAPAERDAAEQTRANSFNYLVTDDTVPYVADADACRAAEHGAALPPHRQLWLIDGDALRRYATDTGDFVPAEIARIKDEWSHVFLDCAAPGVLDDFTHGMRRLRPDPVCAGCARRAVCGRRFAVVEGPPYAREEAWIAAHMAGLRGHILDVGCGEQLYRDILAPLVRDGAVTYHGLDPDAPALERLRAVIPEGSYTLGSIEEFEGVPASCDHILSLRSLNHVRDLDLAIARMAALLRPGGQLLLVETTPFAMLRRPAQVAAADRAPRAGHQHFRNVTSEEILPLATRHGLRVVHHHAVGFDTTNQWLLLLSRTGTGT